MMSNNTVRQIALYGKGGIGKSTIACNLSIALTDMGYKMMQMGCSPKTDSTTFLLGGEIQEPAVLDLHMTKGINAENVYEAIVQGYKGIYCAEAGGPEPAGGCAGRGVGFALDSLKKYGVQQKLGIDIVIYDCIADVTCGGFGHPMRAGYAEEVYIVTSGELMAAYSCNNICIAISDIANSGGNTRVGGIIDNMRGVENEIPFIEELASVLGVPVMAHIPRNPIVQEAEGRSGSVLQIFPDSEFAQIYRELAKNIAENKNRYIPTPTDLEGLSAMYKKYLVFDAA